MKSLFDQLQADADRRSLPEPSSLRLMSDRRAARRRATTGVAAVVVLAGAVALVQPLFLSTKYPDAFPYQSVSPSTPGAVPQVVGRTQTEAEAILKNAGYNILVKEGSELTPGDSNIGRVERQELEPQGGSQPTIKTVIIYIAIAAGKLCDNGYPQTLPDALFIPGHENREICFVEGKTEPGKPPFAYAESLPRPCEPTNLRSDALIEDRRGFTSLHNEGTDTEPAPISFDQVVTKYRDDGAAAYLDEIRNGVESCDPVTRDKVRVTYAMVSSKPFGDERLMLKVEYKWLETQEASPQTSTYAVSIVRVGNYVSVIYDQGWEGLPSKPETIETLAKDVAELLAKVT